MSSRRTRERKRVREANGGPAIDATDFLDVDMDAFEDEPSSAPYRAPARSSSAQGSGKHLAHVPYYSHLGADDFDDD